MRLSRLGLLLVLLGSRSALAQALAAPAVEPAATPSAPVSAPAAPEPAPTPADAPAAPEPPAASPVAEPAPAPATATPTAPPIALPLDAAGTLARPASDVTPAPAPWIRAHSPLTLEGRLGFVLRPNSGSGFDHESNVGAELGLSLYLELKRELAMGLEIERASLGGGSAINKLDSVNVDYTVSSAMLGLRAYPKRTELIDVFVGFQIGVGIQGVSATGTANNGSLLPASAYRCGASDTPALQIGGGAGARLMLTPRWGLTARLNGTARRLTDEFVEDCARGIGTTTTVTAGLGLGYDFDMEP